MNRLREARAGAIRRLAGLRSIGRPARRALAAALLILVAAGGLLLAGVIGRQSTLKGIRERGALRVGMDPSFPPFESYDGVTGQPVGLDVDLARAIAGQWGVKTEIVSLGFDELVDAVAAHQVDAALSAMPVQPERTREVRFSDPYVQAGVVLAVRRGSAIAAPADLSGRPVAVEWGSQGDAAARRLQETGLNFTLLPAETVDAALDALAAGDADAAIVDAISLAMHGQAARLAVVGDPLVSDPYVVVTPADAPDLLKAVNESLQVLESDGTLDSLRARWLRPPPS